MDCIKCDCSIWLREWENRKPERDKEKLKWDAMSQAERDAEIADMQEQLKAVSLDPNLTIVTRGICICECHKEICL